MGHMKWIHCMVADNSYELFKTCYETAKKSKSKSFMFNHSKIDTNYAKYVCEFVDKHCMPEYEEHLINSVNK
tara:strand:+ start:490 stop:705 length:216 start_codon:yes stop_codon:yes gene_type:complete